MSCESDKDKLCRCVIDCQRNLYAYILKLLADANDAKDVLQDTNVILLAKEEEFSQVDNFGAWAARIAYYQVLAFRSRKKRAKVRFDDELVRLLAEEHAEGVSVNDSALLHLGACIERLGRRDGELLSLRYNGNRPIAAIAGEVGRTAKAVTQALYRIRSTLMKCVEHAMRVEGELE